MKHLLYSSLLVCLFSVFGTPCSSSAEEKESFEQNWGRGPVELTNQYPLGVLHSSWTPQSTRIVKPGVTESRLAFAWNSTYSSEPSYRVDAESRELLLSVSHGFFPNFQFAVDLPLQWRGAGVLDAFIDSFHDFTGLPDGGRDDVPTDQYLVAGRNADGSSFQLDSDGTELGNVRTRWKYLFEEGDGVLPAWALEYRMSFPTSGDTFGHDGVDLSLGLIGSKRLSNWVLYWGAAWFYYHDVEIGGVQFRRNHYENFVSVEYEILPTWSANTALIWSSETVDNVEMHPHHSMYLDIATTVELDDDNELELLVRENPSARHGSVDVTFLFALRHSWS